MSAVKATASFWRACMLAALFAAALAGCGGGGSGDSTAAAGTPASSTTPGTTPTPGSNSAPAPLAANAVQVTLDRGSDGAAFNSPFVSVTVCAPGTTSCQTIDHVLVDTGSYGLRLAASAVSSLTLPAVTTAAGAAVGECAHFVDGYAWGAVRRADVKLASETAAAVPVQVVGDTGGAYANVPPACSNTGSNFGTALGANGILGVGLFAQDCPVCVASAAPTVYFACTASGCTSTAMPLTSQVTNPVAAFAQDNNGVVLTLPPVPAGGAATLTGSLVFGIGTQANNQVTSQTVFNTDSQGNIRTTYKGSSMSGFLDSGSNALFFTDAAIPQCSGFYCPPAPLPLSATMTSATGVSQNVNFTIESITSIASNATVANVGADAGLGHTFDWGLPFFFGRSVYVAMAGAITPKGVGPYWAW
jgi:hypothetical protein